MNKLIFLDIDGTLLRDNGTFNDKIKKVIEKHHQKNNKIILTSARPRNKVIDICNQLNLNTYFISSNGAEIYDYDKCKKIYTQGISKSSILYIYNLALKYNIQLILAINNKEYTVNADKYDNRPKATEIILRKYKVKQCMIISGKLSVLKRFIKKLDVLDDISFTLNIETLENDKYWYSVVNRDVSKGNACVILSNLIKINLKNTIGIGNDYNDISMFKLLGKSVAVENATDSIKTMVDTIIDSNNNDGVYKYLKKILK
ncbi:MAG: HAD family hydrolase [Bacilli bacterium]|nr:HAD family hydrolase [Bacilli bacterium]